MEENEQVHSDYLKGYNEGYILQKYMPELADRLAGIDNPSERGNGFKDGREQFINETKANRFPTWLRDDRLSNMDRESDPSKDKDDRDLDR